MNKKPTIPLYQGEQDLTVTTLEKLKNRRTVSKQFIIELCRNPNMRLAERSIIEHALATFPDTAPIPIKKFADSVKRELLPLKTTVAPNFHERSYTLSHKIRGNVANYEEIIYQSPVKTPFGKFHFKSSRQDEFRVPQKYFAHTRLENMADGKTRRILEIQSDLFQRNRLRFEISNVKPKVPARLMEEYKLLEQRRFYPLFTKEDKKRYEEIVELGKQRRRDELAKLEPYRNIWHERIIKEEVRRAAASGKRQLLFPTGETAIQIERLERQVCKEYLHNETFTEVRQDELKEGLRMWHESEVLIVVRVLEGGKFTAIPESAYDVLEKGLPISNEETGRIRQQMAHNLAQGYDLTQTMDTNHPIYKFYEKEIGAYLKKNYEAVRTVDDKGVSWWKTAVRPELATRPILAIGLPDKLPLLDQKRVMDRQEQKNDTEAKMLSDETKEQGELDSIRSIRASSEEITLENRDVDIL